MQHDLRGVDFLLLLDANNSYVSEEIHRTGFKGRVISLLHDVLPLTNPHWYMFSNRPDYLKEFRFYLMRMKKISDLIITPSNDNLKALKSLDLFDNQCEIQVIPFGTFRNLLPVSQRKENAKSIISVNTLEPKKGHNDMIDAFDYLMTNDGDYTLTFVGKEGWDVKHLVRRIMSHREFNKRLFWFNKLDDSGLDTLYSKASISICASEGEGFGLTLEEALSYGMKVICRDMPVFRERKYKNIFYFEGGGINLAERIEFAQNSKLIYNQQIRSMSNFADDLLTKII
jgi:glycosyltransferase involved in cell wall biosynthesis